MAELHIDFVELEKKDLKGYTLIEGFPGMGLVGTIAAKYLVERLEFKEIGHIESNVFAPIIRIHEGVPVYPSRIYVSEKNKLVVLISEQIIPRNMTFKLAKAVVEWIEAKGIKEVISLAGITTGSDKDNQIIYGIAANEEAKKLLQGHGIEVIKEGITTGVTALMLLELKKADINAFSIMGNVKIAADYKAAAALIEKLNEILELKIDVAPLLKEAKETEKELLKHLQKLRETSDTVQKLEGEQTPMYA